MCSRFRVMAALSAAVAIPTVLLSSPAATGAEARPSPGEAGYTDCWSLPVSPGSDRNWGWHESTGDVDPSAIDPTDADTWPRMFFDRRAPEAGWVQYVGGQMPSDYTERSADFVQENYFCYPYIPPAEGALTLSVLELDGTPIVEATRQNSGHELGAGPVSIEANVAYGSTVRVVLGYSASTPEAVTIRNAHRDGITETYTHGREPYQLDFVGEDESEDPMFATASARAFGYPVPQGAEWTGFTCAGSTLGQPVSHGDSIHAHCSGLLTMYDEGVPAPGHGAKVAATINARVGLNESGGTAGGFNSMSVNFVTPGVAAPEVPDVENVEPVYPQPENGATPPQPESPPVEVEAPTAPQHPELAETGAEESLPAISLAAALLAAGATLLQRSRRRERYEW